MVRNPAKVSKRELDAISSLRPGLRGMRASTAITHLIGSWVVAIFQSSSGGCRKALGYTETSRYERCGCW
jgi:hypothetical protein